MLTPLGLSFSLAAYPVGEDPAVEPVPLPELESDPSGTVVAGASRVSLVEGKVTIDLTVKSGEEHPALLMTGEPFGWTGASGIYATRQFPELQFRIDDDSVTPSDRFEAFAGATDITNMLVAVQMDPWAVTKNPPLAIAHVSSRPILTALKNIGAIKNASDPATGDYLAKWTVRRSLRIPLKNASEQHVELTYTARPRHSVAPVDEVVTRARERAYCITPKSLYRLLHRAGSEALTLTIDEYIIPLGIDGTPPSTVSFKMTGRSADRQFVFFCALHGNAVAKTDTVTLQRADVDDRGRLHVMSIARSRPGVR